MRMMALMFLILAPQAQDVDEWIEKLGAGDFAVREEAQVELTKIGEPALKALRIAAKGDDAEIAQRARDIVAKIEQDLLVRKSIKRGTRVTVILADRPASEVARAIGYEIRYSGDLESKSVTLQHRDAELLRVLDDLARQVGKAYRFDGAKTIVFGSDDFVDYPAAYNGPFKFKLTRIRTTTDNAITDRKTTVDFDVAVEHEPGSEAAESKIEFTLARDGQGRNLEWAEESDPAGGNFSMSSMSINGKTIKIVDDGKGGIRVIEEGVSGQGQRVTLRDITTPVAKFSTVKGEMLVVVPTQASRKVSFTNPSQGDSQNVGGVDISVEDVGDGFVELAFRGRNLPKKILNEDSIVIRSGDDEIEAEVFEEDDGFDDLDRDMKKLKRRLRRLERRSSRAARTFLVRVPKKARDSVDTLTFTIKEVVRHKVPFEFKDVDLR